MANESLQPFAYAVLVLVGENGAGPHDLVRMARQGRVYAAAAESQYYAEPKRLERLGYLASEKQPGRTHERTHYRLTAKGREALQAWAREPLQFPGIRTEPIVRLLATDLVGPEAVLEGLRPLREDIVDLLGRLDVAEAAARTLPHREPYLLLNHRLARRILEAHLEWLDEAERTLTRRRTTRRRGTPGTPRRTRGSR
jgi:DNA-binding PadR family transcriptional regulator